MSDKEAREALTQTTMLGIFHETAREWYETHPQFLVAFRVKAFHAIRAGKITLRNYIDFEVSNELRLKEMAAKDFLTGLWARAGFEERYREVFEQSTKSLTVINLDIDNFGEVNDAFDHETGDSVLKIFAELLKAATSKSGFAARMGGDEFVIVWPETPTDKAQTTAQGIMEQFSQQLLELDEKISALDITVSAGIYTSEPGDDKATILRRADQAERASKREGGKRAFVWRPEYEIKIPPPKDRNSTINS